MWIEINDVCFCFVLLGVSEISKAARFTAAEVSEFTLLLGKVVLLLKIGDLR